MLGCVSLSRLQQATASTNYHAINTKKYSDPVPENTTKLFFHGLGPREANWNRRKIDAELLRKVARGSVKKGRMDPLSPPSYTKEALQLFPVNREGGGVLRKSTPKMDM